MSRISFDSGVQVDQRAAEYRQSAAAANLTWDRDRGQLLSDVSVINKLRWNTNFPSEWITSSLLSVE